MGRPVSTDLMTRIIHDTRAQVTNLANASSLIYNALLAFPEFGDGPSAVNWCGERDSYSSLSSHVSFPLLYHHD